MAVRACLTLPACCPRGCASARVCLRRARGIPTRPSPTRHLLRQPRVPACCPSRSSASRPLGARSSRGCAATHVGEQASDSVPASCDPGSGARHLREELRVHALQLHQLLGQHLDAGVALEDLLDVDHPGAGRREGVRVPHSAEQRLSRPSDGAPEAKHTFPSSAAPLPPPLLRSPLPRPISLLCVREAGLDELVDHLFVLVKLLQVCLLEFVHLPRGLLEGEGVHGSLQLLFLLSRLLDARQGLVVHLLEVLEAV
ncbi:hypothetical protein T484DRAFT_1932453 [Baffinella frigidus]|nr:hypothetical protein T484DRAFT_1932453 [Cryptophyta sp. CCMP2293]